MPSGTGDDIATPTIALSGYFHRLVWWRTCQLLSDEQFARPRGTGLIRFVRPSELDASGAERVHETAGGLAARRAAIETRLVPESDHRRRRTRSRRVTSQV